MVATGIPRGSRNGRGPDYRIEYADKLSEEGVLRVERAALETAMRVDGEPTNRLIYGDNLPVLASLLDDPEVAGEVTLIYIDPPYAKGARFESRAQQQAYEDLLSGASYLEFLRRRLILMRELLSERGSIYVHLDSKMVFETKLIMDEIFGPQNFRNFIVRKKGNRKNYTRKQYGNYADYIIFYSRGSDWTWNQPFEEWTEEWIKREYAYVDEKSGRRYKKVPVHAPGVRNGETGKEWRGMEPPPGKHWQYRPEKLDELDAKGEIYWSPNGNPRRKLFFDETRGVPVQDIWMDFRDAHNQMVRITGYPTEKNAGMLRRIVEASSNPGDLVLDAFAGSGTIADVSESLGRRWICIDNSPLAMDTTIARLARGTQPMGDFVKKRNGSDQEMLFHSRVLKSGLELQIESSSSLEAVSEHQIKEWRNLLASSPANLA